MSKKNSGYTTLDASDEKVIINFLRDHIRDGKDGVIKRPSQPLSYPLIDAATAANSWKINYPTKFGRYTKQRLEQVIQQVYPVLQTEHNNNNNITTTNNNNSNTTTLTPQQSEMSRAPSSTPTQNNNNTKKGVKVKEPAIIKRQKSNTSFIPTSQSTTISSNDELLTTTVQLQPLQTNDMNMRGIATTPISTPNTTTNNNSSSFSIDLSQQSTNKNVRPRANNNNNTNNKSNNQTIDLDDDDDDFNDSEDIDDIDIDLIHDNDNDDDFELMTDNDDEFSFQQNENNNNNNDITMLDDQTSKLSLLHTNSQQPPSTPTLDHSLSNKANFNNALNNIYNPNAIPYDQRPQPPSQQKQSKQQQQQQQPFLTKRQQQENALKAIRQDAKENVPHRVQVQQRYRSYIQKGHTHAEAEELARKDVKEANANGGSNNNSKSKTKDGKDKSNGPTVVPIKPTVTLKDVAGIDNIIQDIREMFEYPFLHPELFQHAGVRTRKGVLLHGPPGSGKTLLANAIAGELNIPLIKIEATEIVSKLSGESEGKIRTTFQEAALHAPCIIFIDDIDVLAGKKDSEDGNDMKRRIVTQLTASIDALGQDNPLVTTTPTTDLSNEELIARNTMMEELASNMKNMKSNQSISERALELNQDDDLMFKTALLNNNSTNKTIFVIGATSRLDTIDMSLRRAGRFDREIALGIPDETARAKILTKLTQKMRLGNDVDFDAIGKATVGFVGADLVALTTEAADLGLNRFLTDLVDSSPDWMDNVINNQNNDNNAINTTNTIQVFSSTSTTTPSSSTTTMNDDDTTPSPLPQNQLSPTTMFATTPQQQQQQPIEGNEIKTIVSTTTTPITTPTPPKPLKLTKTQQDRLDLAKRVKIAAFLRTCGRLTPEQLTNYYTIQIDFLNAAKKIKPTAKREGFATVPETTWADVGALDLLRAELDMAIVQPIQNPELFEELGLQTPAGVLLFGPPGCGKTLVAKAVANASGASFLSVKGPELLNQYVGESERAVRSIFQKASMCSPCVIFFDEIDALVPRRGGSSNQASDRVVNQLLTELDGFDGRRQVFVIAATNRPDIIDPAVLRPGRLDKLVFLPLPDADGRLSILFKHTRRTPLDLSPYDGNNDDEKRMNMLRIVAYDQRAENYSGADLQAIVREATTAALKEYQSKRFELIKSGLTQDDLNVHVQHKIVVTMRHFNIAFGSVVASVNEQARKQYEKLCQTMTQGKGILRENIHTVQDGSQTGGTSR